MTGKNLQVTRRVSTEQINYYKQEIEAYKGQVDDDQRVISKLKTDIISVQQHLSHVNVRLTSTTDSSVQDLEDQISYWKGKYEAVLKLYQGLRSEHMKMVAELEELKARTGSEEDLEKLKAHIQDQSKLIAKNAKENEKAKKDLEKLKSSQKEEISSLNRKLMDFNILLKDSVDSNELESFISKIEKEREEVLALEDKMREFREIELGDVTKAKAELESKICQVESLKDKEAKELQRKIGHVNDNVESKRGALQEVLEPLRAQWKRLQHERSQLGYDLLEELKEVFIVIEHTKDKLENLGNNSFAQFVDCSKKILEAMRILMKSSESNQKETIGNSDPLAYYMENTSWTRGLLNAVKSITHAVVGIGDSNRDLVCSSLENPNINPLLFAAHNINSGTLQLVIVHRSKSIRGSSTQIALEENASALGKHTTFLFNLVKNILHINPEDILGKDYLNISLSNEMNPYDVDPKFKMNEMTQQVKILDLEKELDIERMRLQDIRHRYVNKPQ